MTKSEQSPEPSPRVTPDPNYKPPLETESIDDPNMLPPDPEQAVAQPDQDAGRKDAPRSEVILYAFGNIEASIADQFFNVLNSIMIVAMHVNPMLLGLIAGIKTLWDGITDPVMAYVTDNTRTRWGRRRPFILIGGVSRISLLVLIVAFMPSGGNLMRNHVMEAQKYANEAIREASDAWRLAVQSYEQLDDLPPDRQDLLLDALADRSQTARDTLAKLDEYQPILLEDLQLREQEAQSRHEQVVLLEAEKMDAPDADSALTIPRGLAEAADDKVAKAEELLTRMDQARRELIAADFVASYLLNAFGKLPNPVFSDQEQTRQAAQTAFAQAGVEPVDDIFSFPVRPPPAPRKSTGMWANIIDGAKAFWAPKNYEQRPLILYTLIAVLLFTTLTTVQSVPYYALGIEVSPSYNGRTQVVTYRAIMNQIAGLVQPWIPVLCFSLVFLTALEGLFWVAVVACVIGIPSTILMCWFVKERTEISASKNREAGLFKSMWQVMGNRHFLKIFALYWLIGLSFGVFTQIGFYLNVYWVMGSALAGAKLVAWVSMVAWGLGFITLPLINWGCRRFQKHRVLQFAIVWMAIGTALKWWCMNPDHPEYQFILPFFFSVGISSVYTVLPTMMADVTDVDELNHGARREGMFGAVMAFLMKIIGTFTPILGGAVLVMSGFDPSLEYEQAPETIFNMRVMYSFVSAGMLITALVILWRYPLTRDRIQEIKAELHRRHLARTQPVAP